MRDLEPIYFDFTEFGLEEPVRLTVLECKVLLEGCEAMLAEHDHACTCDMMERISTRLLARALANRVDEEWLANAAMIVCLRGLMGGEISQHILDQD